MTPTADYQAREAAKRDATLAYLAEKNLTTSGSFERGFEAGWDALSPLLSPMPDEQLDAIEKREGLIEVIESVVPEGVGDWAPVIADAIQHSTDPRLRTLSAHPAEKTEGIDHADR